MSWYRGLTAAVAAVIMTGTAQAQTMFVNDTAGLMLRRSCSVRDEILTVMPYAAQVDELDHIGIGSAVWSKLTYHGLTGYAVREFLDDTDPLAGRQYMGKWTVTAYAETGYPCANGQYPTVGYTVACNALPFGTRVYIDGVGIRAVEDTDGGAMGYEWIDLYLGDYTECMNFGAQSLDVWVIDDETK